MRVGIKLFKDKEQSPAFEFTQQELHNKVEEYLGQLRTAPTLKFCGCEWIIHPEDVDKPEGQRRMRPGTPDTMCPMHDTTGRILYFFEWLRTNA